MTADRTSRGRGGALRWLALAVGLVAAVGCAPAKVTINESPKLGEYTVRSLAILPFEGLHTPQSIDTGAADLYVPSGMIRSNISVTIPLQAERLDTPTVTVPNYAPEKVTRLVSKRLQQWDGLKVIPPEDAKGAIPPSTPGQSPADATEEAAKQLAKAVAEKLSTDAVLVGRVLIYKERGGTKMGGSPATVGFELRLIAADGTTLWIGSYYEKQRPMTEDIAGFWERGGVFVTADELAHYGVDHVLEKFPFGIRPEKVVPEDLS